MADLSFDFWMFIAGLGVFLFGMYHLENGLKGLAGRSFRNVVRRFTNSTWKGILTGTVVTAILQSSSLVTLLVLAFLGSGMISLRNSIGVVLGANLGTTATAWIVVTLGFKINVADLSFPFLAIGTLSYLMLDSRPMIKNLGSFLIGFGLLFFGLDNMKLAFEGLAGSSSLESYAGLGLWVYLLIGIILTALIQSSSAAIVIVLSALNAELLNVYQAFALVIGANIGTTSTLVIATLKGSADKRRLSLANILFNVVTGILAFAFSKQLVDWSVNFLGIEDVLMQLVWLNTLLNLGGIVIFLPFITPFGNFIAGRYKSIEPESACRYIRNVVPGVPDVAIDALGRELKLLFGLTTRFISDGILLKNGGAEDSNLFLRMIRTEENPLIRYQELKQIEDEITGFYTQIQEQNLSEEEAGVLAQYMHELRSMIYAAKNIKDVSQNIKVIDESDDPLAREVLKRMQGFVHETIQKLSADFESNALTHKPDFGFERFYSATVEYLYANAGMGIKGEVPVSTITNLIKKVVASMEDLARVVYAGKFLNGENGDYPKS